MWVSYQFGEDPTQDFYAARVYDTTHGVGGLATPQLTVAAASTVSQWQNYMTELHVTVTNIPSATLASDQRLLLEVAQSGAPGNGNNRTIAFHNVTQSGPVKQIDCLCSWGVTGAYAPSQCYSTYIGDFDDQRLTPTPYIAIMDAVAQSSVDCYVPYVAVQSATTQITVTAKITNPQYRKLWYDSSGATAYRVSSFYQGASSPPITFTAGSAFLSSGDTAYSWPAGGNTVNAVANFTLNVTNGTLYNPPAQQWTYSAGDIIFIAFPYGAPTLSATFCGASAAGGALNCPRAYTQVNQGCFCTVATPQYYYTLTDNLVNQAAAWGATGQKATVFVTNAAQSSFCVYQQKMNQSSPSSMTSTGFYAHPLSPTLGNLGGLLVANLGRSAGAATITSTGAFALDLKSPFAGGTARGCTAFQLGAPSAQLRCTMYSEPGKATGRAL